MRRRYVLHWATWVAMAAVGVALSVESAAGQLFPEVMGVKLKGPDFHYYHGWPAVFMERESLFNSFDWADSSRWILGGSRSHQFSACNLAIDVFIAIVLVVGTGVTIELYARREKRWHQFDIPSLLKLTLVVAVLLTLHQGMSVRLGFSGPKSIPLPPMWSGDAAWEYLPLTPIALSIACAVNVVWLATAAVLRLLYARSAPERHGASRR